MLRCRADDPVFSLQGERYLGSGREKSGSGHRRTIRRLAADRGRDHQGQPGLHAAAGTEGSVAFHVFDRSAGFRRGGSRAKAEKRTGDLELLSQEVLGFEWESEGLRVVGRARFALEA